MTTNSKLYIRPDYGNRLIRSDGRPRRVKSGKAAMQRLWQAIIDVFESSAERLGARRVAYLLVGKVIDKHRFDFARVEVQVRKMFEDGRIDPDKLADESRPCIETPCWADEQDFLASVIPQYRSDPWLTQPQRVYVSSEKKGLGPVLEPVTDRYLVPLYLTGGYNGNAATWALAKRIVQSEQDAVVLQTGDLDSDGLQIADSFKKKLLHAIRRVAQRLGKPVPKVEFRRIALLPEHIRRYGIITHDQKASEATKRFPVEVAAEIDALDPQILRELLTAALRRYMPDQRLAAHDAADEAVREKLRRRAQRFAP